MAKKLTYVKTSSLAQKIGQLAAALMLIIAVVSMWLNVSYQGKDLLSENAEVLAKSILLQTSHSAQKYIENEDIDALHQLADSAMKSDYILEMVIYDNQGIVMSKSDNAITTRARFITDLSKEVESLNPAPFVKEIRNEDNDLLGFVRITILKKNLQNSGLTFVTDISAQIIILAVLCLLIGYLLTIGLRPFSSNSYYVKD